MLAALRSLRAPQPAEHKSDDAPRPSLRELRRPLVLLLVFHGERSRSRHSATHRTPVAQQCSGINSVFFNVKSLFSAAGVRRADVAALASVLMQLPFSAVACALLDRSGRRPLLICSCVGTAAAAAALATALSLPQSAASSRLALAGACAYRIFFSLGLGPSAFHSIHCCVDPPSD